MQMSAIDFQLTTLGDLILKCVYNTYINNGKIIFISTEALVW